MLEERARIRLPSAERSRRRGAYKWWAFSCTSLGMRMARWLAAARMTVAAAGLAGMTTLDAASPYWLFALWLALVGIGSGVFNSPNTSAMMGVVPKNRRGVAAGTRTMLQKTGAVISISFVLAIVTAGIPKTVLFRIFSGLATGLPQKQVDLFIANLHEAVLVLAAFSLLGAIVSLLRPSHRPERAA